MVDTGMGRDDGRAVSARASASHAPGMLGGSGPVVNTGMHRDDGQALRNRVSTGAVDWRSSAGRDTVHIHRNHAQGVMRDAHTWHKEVTARTPPVPDSTPAARPVTVATPSAARREFDAMLAASTYSVSTLASHGARAAMVRRAKHTKDASVLGGPAPITDDAADAPGV